MTDVQLSVRGVSVAFGGLVAVDNVDLRVRRGSVHGLIGPNGAGKTTFLNALSGLVRVTRGTITWDGEDITALPTHRRAAAGIARTFQHLQLIEERTVLENILIGMHFDGPGGSALSRLWPGSDDARIKRVREIMEFLEFDVDAVALASVETLTLYQRRRVEVARALALSPSLLLLDELGAGLSPASLEAIARVIRKINRELGMTIILIEHVISLVMNLCDEVTVLDKGAVIANGPPAAVAADPLVRNAYLGQASDA